MKKIIGMSLVSLAMSTLLLAESQENYITTNYGWLTHSENGTASDFEMTGFKWTIGKRLSEFYGVELAGEVSAMLGVKHETKSTVASSSSGTFSNASIALERLYNVNLRLNKELMEDVALQGYFGVSTAKIVPQAVNNVPNRPYKHSLSYGAGLSYHLIPEVALQLQYLQYFENLSSLEMGLRFEF